MENFFEDHCQDAFGCMVEALGEDFSAAAATVSSGETLSPLSFVLHAFGGASISRVVVVR